jgi:hypothetical protein
MATRDSSGVALSGLGCSSGERNSHVQPEWVNMYKSKMPQVEIIFGNPSLAVGTNGMIAITGSSDGNLLPNSTISEYATVVYLDPVSTIHIELVSGQARITFDGWAGYAYEIQRPSAVNGPWDTIAVRNTPVDDLLEFTDTNAPPPRAFYRVSRR